MTMMPFILVLLVCPLRTTSSNAPNILLIVADDQGYSDLSLTGMYSLMSTKWTHIYIALRLFHYSII